MSSEIDGKDIDDIDELLKGDPQSYKDANHNGLPESPASLNIKFWADGYGVMLTMRDEDVSKLMGKFKFMLDVVKKAGYKNKWDEEPIRVLPETQPIDEKPKICSIHGTPLIFKSGISKKTGKPYSFYGCNQKLTAGSWCPGTPMGENGQK